MLFRRLPPITRADAVDSFLVAATVRFQSVYTTLVDVYLRPRFRRTLEIQPDYFELPGVQSVLFAAMLATELHAMQYVMQPIEATRTHARAMQALIVGGLSTSDVAIMDRVKLALCGAQLTPDTLATALGEALYEPLGCLDWTETAAGTFADPLTVVAIGSAVAFSTAGWWKHLVAEYRVVD